MVERDDLWQALDAALAAVEAGASVDSALSRYPALANELRPLLLAARAAGATAELARVPIGEQISSRSQFLAGAAQPRLAVAPVPDRGWLARLRSFLAWRPMAGSSLATRALVTALVVVTGLGAGTYGAVAASAQSLPGDALYGVKRTVEDTQLLLAADDQSRTELQAEFDDRRVHEVLQVANQRRQVPVDFSGVLISIEGPQSENWLVSGIAVLVGPQVPVDGHPVVGGPVRVLGMVDAAGVVEAQRVTVLSRPSAPQLTPTVTASGTPAPVQPTAAATATLAPPDTNTPRPAATNAVHAEPSATPQPASPKPPEDTPEPSATAITGPAATDTDAPGVSATETDTPGESASSTPEATDTEGYAGPSPTHKPKGTEGGYGGDHTETPEPTEHEDHTGTPRATAHATDDHHSTPQATGTHKPDD